MEEISKFESLFFCNALSPMKVVTELNQQALNVQACIELFNILQLNQIR
jgi:4-amino-4-deoxychorismate lyase